MQVYLVDTRLKYVQIQVHIRKQIVYNNRFKLRSDFSYQIKNKKVPVDMSLETYFANYSPFCFLQH